VFKIGTGRPTNLLQLVRLLGPAIPGADGIEPSIVGRFREGDIRCCYADITRATRLLGFAPRVALEEGVKILAAWVARQSSPDRSETALEELRQHGPIR
jgi:dTDP-L-rhamnose 4-epimerase